MTLCNCKEDLKKKVHAIIDKFAERGLRSLGVARQVRNAIFLHYRFLFPCICASVYLLSVFSFILPIDNTPSLTETTLKCLQEVPQKSKDSPGGPWQFVGLLSLFDPPRHDSAETIRRALNLGVNVKMITGNLVLHPSCQCHNHIFFICS